jgi:LysM domain
MSKFGDIVDGTVPNVDSLRSGLVYTCRCGWIDLGHARPDNAARLWHRINTETGEGRVGGLWYRVDFEESMAKWGLRDSAKGSFAVRRGLSRQEKESVALGILLNVSDRFEKLQGGFPYRLVTDSGYSAEDLVSNLVGFYRAVRPGFPYIKECRPVSKAAAEDVWKRNGAVGALKNPFAGPFLFPCTECPGGPHGPISAMLPNFLSLVEPVPPGELYQPWDPKLVSEDPVQPLQLGINLYVVQSGDSLSKIAAQYYGNVYLWPLIYDSNRNVVGPNPNLIHPGLKLLIPDVTKFSADKVREAEQRGRPHTLKVPPPR